MKRLTTRSIATAEAIRDRVPFTTSGNLEGCENTSHYIYSGYLRGADAEALRVDSQAGVIDYVVLSYSTPIAWHRTDDTWHIVSQSFSTTTSKHQGNLYMAGVRYPRPRIVWCGMKNRVNQGYDLLDQGLETIGHADTREQANAAAHYYYLNGTLA